MRAGIAALALAYQFEHETGEISEFVRLLCQLLTTAGDVAGCSAGGPNWLQQLPSAPAYVCNSN